MGLKIYKASAGSGKTYNLASEIITVLINQQEKNPDIYKNILAVTFTNKAAGELKIRVISVLKLLSEGKNDKGYFDNVKEKTNLPDYEIRSRAERALKYILHDYSRFSISTIDRFFNSVLANFSYELNLRPDSVISLDDKIVREQAIDKLLESFDINTPLGKWLLKYSELKVEEDSNWNIRNELLKESSALTNESFLSKYDVIKDKTDKKILSEYRDEILKLKNKHENVLKKIGREMLELIENSPYNIDDFSHGDKSAVGFVTKMEREGFRDISSRALAVIEEPDKLVSKKRHKETDLLEFATSKCLPLIEKAVDYIEKNQKEYYTAKHIAKSFNSFGVMLDINENLRELCSEKNIYFPFQMSQLLHNIVSLDNAMFIYEKIGTRYLHYFLDEFQDTSRMQWDIMLPLIEESLAGGGESLIVGDVKQAIYRWRNGDWNLLKSEVEKQLPSPQLNSLDSNYRSAPNIVKFNNLLYRLLIPSFDTAYAAVDENDETGLRVKDFFSEFDQVPKAKKSQEGYIQLKMLENEEEISFNEKALDQMVEEMNNLREKSYSYSDFAVLTRKNDEAGEVAMRLMKEGFPVVSASSLLLIENPAVNLILAALKHIYDPSDKIALLKLVSIYQQDILGEKQLNTRDSNPDTKNFFTENMYALLPEDFIKGKNKLSAFPLYDLIENLILWFDLYRKPEYNSYLTAFQDNVLLFSENNPVEISAFVEWFENKSPKLEMPDSSSAVVISTVHNAKGLEFPFVFMPFTNWEIQPRKDNTNIWAKPQAEPFNKIPLVMVGVNEELKNSYFSELYLTEKFNKHIDLLNLFYVATTRAEEGLFLWAEDKEIKKQTKLSSLNILLKTGFFEGSNPDDEGHVIEDYTSYLSSDGMEFNYGDYPKEKIEIQEEERGAFLNDYPLNIRPQSFRYHHPDAFLDLNKDEVIRKKTTKGSVCHAVLENVYIPGDIPEAIEKIIRQGRIDREEGVAFEKLIENAISENPVREWFNKDLQVMNEREIVLPDGNFIKPDRVVFKDNSAIVIDYKFGKKYAERYKKQLKNYTDALKKMGYDDVKGYLWYVLENETVEVE